MHLVARWIPTYAACVVSLVAHEVAHAWAASMHGDPTARDQGRRTLNPLPHLDLWGSIVVPWILIATASPLLFAWARPAPVDHARLRRPRPDTLRVALAGPLANLLLALLFAGLARAIPQGASWAAARATAVAGVAWNCGLLLFNLIPIPPLDGSHLLYHALPARLGSQYRGLQRFGYLPLFALMFLFRPAMQILLAPAIGMMNFLGRLIAPYGVGPLAGA